MKKITILLAIYLIIFSLSACGETTLEGNEDCTNVITTDLLQCNLILTSYFDTTITLALYIEKDVDSTPIFTEVKNIVRHYHELSDKYNTYEDIINIKSINDDPTTTHIVDDDLYNMIKFSLDHQTEVNGLFNIALNPVLNVWHSYSDECNFDPYTKEGTGECLIPTENELNTAALNIDQTKIVLDEINSSITLSSNMSLDLGGMSKGYMSEVVTTYLDSQKIHGYLFNAGTSNVEIGGLHPTRDNEKFRVAITDPTNIVDYYATVYLSGGESIVSSGDYQRYFMSDGLVYHHIINPETLMPERLMRSVSIVYTNPALADIYSTAIFLMPINEGINFVNSVPGLEGIWYGLDGTIYFSENFETDYLDNLY